MQKIILDSNLPAYELFISSDNFRLAWERVRYFDRKDSRDLIGLKVFAANRDYNLEMLRKSVAEKTFEPSYPEIKYFPKSSHTLRPMAIVGVSDRIVFQAIANVVAEKSRAPLGMITNRQSFANVLTESGETPLFIHWKRQYKLYQDKFVELIKEGNVWLAETDAAAFYETIDHHTLKDLLTRKGFLDDDIMERLETWLPVWSSVKTGGSASRGVPQGSLASDLLANLFLYEFDGELASKQYHYLRYVDDIKILGKTKEDVQRGLIHIDMGLKALGILLQTKKTTVRKITDIQEEVDRLASQLSDIDQRMREPEPIIPPPADPIFEPSMHDIALLGDDFDMQGNSSEPIPSTQEELQTVFWNAKQSIESGKEDQFAERHLKFCLYRLEPESKITDAILPYLKEKPWLDEIIAFYIKKCELGTTAINFLQDIVSYHNVYDSVVAIAIEILLKQKTSLRAQHNLFRQWVSDEKRSWILLNNALIALGDSSDNMSVVLQGMKSNSPTVRRMAIIQALRLSRNQNEAIHICQAAIKDHSPIVIDALLYLMYNEHSLTLAKLNVGQESVSEYCLTVAKGYDLSLPAFDPDYIRHKFVKFYFVDIPTFLDFRAFLGTHYDSAAKFLNIATGSYLVNPSRYVSQLNLFHEELLYPIMVDKLKLKNTKEELALVEFGNRLDMLKAKRELAVFCGAVLSCNTLRANPETHGRLHRQLTETSPVSPKQRDALKKSLCAGYQELVSWILAGCP